MESGDHSLWKKQMLIYVQSTVVWNKPDTINVPWRSLWVISHKLLWYSNKAQQLYKHGGDTCRILTVKQFT